MKKFLVRIRVTRVHEFEIEAEDEDDAREIAADLDESGSARDQFDSQEFMDATPVEQMTDG